MGILQGFAVEALTQMPVGSMKNSHRDTLGRGKEVDNTKNLMKITLSTSHLFQNWRLQIVLWLHLHPNQLGLSYSRPGK